MSKNQSSVVVEKAENEVKYYLKEHQKELSDARISSIAAKALNMYLNNGYSSLEAAVEDLMDHYGI